MGLSRSQLALRYREIVGFSGIGDFIDLPVKYYSSGMVARLAFSVAVNVQPDILLLDEVLAVGDQAFQRKCLDRLRAFRSGGCTMILVSHNEAIVRELCSRALWLEKGEIRMEGEVEEVLDAYLWEAVRGCRWKIRIPGNITCPCGKAPEAPRKRSSRWSWGCCGPGRWSTLAAATGHGLPCSGNTGCPTSSG